jgi:hypothetical protein
MKTIKERFWQKVDKGNGRGCWIWTGALDTSGYGQMRVYKKNEKAARISYRLNKGPIPGKMQVLHKCDIRCCVRPSHLFLGNNDINVADKVAKGRQSRGYKHSAVMLKAAARGENHFKSKLTEKDVIEIARRLSLGVPKVVIAESFGVNATVIGKINRKEIWKHVNYNLAGQSAQAQPA